MRISVLHSYKLIKKILLGLAVLLSALVHPSRIAADTLPPPKVYTKTDLVQIVNQYGKEYHVSPQVITSTISCEDTTWDSAKQSDIVKNGVREESYGLAQINLPSNPNVTLAQATDPEFAIKFMAKEMSEGHANKWSCYRKLYN